MLEDNSISDEHHLQKFISGDNSAIDSIYRKYYQDLFLYGQRFGAEDYIIEETIQDLFLNFFKYKKSLKKIKVLRPYVFRSFRNLLLSKLKEINDFVLINENETEDNEIFPDKEGLIKKVKLLINSLSNREKEIILLKFYENYSNSEIASILEIDYKTVRNLISRAFKKLRKLNKDEIDLFFILFARTKTLSI